MGDRAQAFKNPKPGPLLVEHTCPHCKRLAQVPDYVKRIYCSDVCEFAERSERMKQAMIQARPA